MGKQSDFILTAIAIGGLSCEGGMRTKNATTNWVFINNIFDVLSRFGWKRISCHDGLSAEILGYRYTRMDETVPMTHVDVNEGE